MAIKDIIARGIGFSPASVKFIVTHGFSLSPAFSSEARIVSVPARADCVFGADDRTFNVPDE